MIIRTETVDGRQIEIHENPTGHRRYWARVNHRALFQGGSGSLRVRAFATPHAAWAAALREARTSPRTPAPTRGYAGYSNPGGGGPFAPMNAPRAARKRGAP